MDWLAAPASTRASSVASGSNESVATSLRDPPVELPVITDSAIAIDRSVPLSGYEHSPALAPTIVDSADGTLLPDSLVDSEPELRPTAEAYDSDGATESSASENEVPLLFYKDAQEDRQLFKDFCKDYNLNRRQRRSYWQKRKSLGTLFNRTQDFLERLAQQYGPLVTNLENDVLQHGLCITESYAGMATGGHAASALVDIASQKTKDPSFPTPFWVYSITEKDMAAQRCSQHT